MTKPTIAAIIIGIDGWEQYTLPLIESIQEHEPDCDIAVIDNASKTPYPELSLEDDGGVVVRTERLCYSEAINTGHSVCGLARITGHDWYIVLSNDVLCTGPFIDVLAGYLNSEVVGPCLKETPIPGYGNIDYLEGWCVAFSRHAWDLVGGWDERFLGSDWEDVAVSTKARQQGLWLVEDLPFVHLDQRQRYYIVDDFAGKDKHNRELFMREYLGVTP